MVRNADDETRLPNLAPEDLPPGYKLRNVVTIYRGVPNGVTEIRPGDWVGLSRDYAAQHGGGTVLSKRVPADHVAWAGSSDEYFYVPREPVEQSKKPRRKAATGGGWLKASDA